MIFLKIHDQYTSRIKLIIFKRSVRVITDGHWRHLFDKSIVLSRIALHLLLNLLSILWNLIFLILGIYLLAPIFLFLRLTYGHRIYLHDIPHKNLLRLLAPFFKNQITQLTPLLEIFTALNLVLLSSPQNLIIQRYTRYTIIHFYFMVLRFLHLLDWLTHFIRLVLHGKRKGKIAKHCPIVVIL